jgi:hypothetical protein
MRNALELAQCGSEARDLVSPALRRDIAGSTVRLEQWSSNAHPHTSDRHQHRRQRPACPGPITRRTHDPRDRPGPTDRSVTL